MDGGAIYIPINYINHVYGVLFLYRNMLFDSRDRQLATIFTDYIAFTLERNSMINKMREHYNQTVHVLAKVIDAKYPSIHRHSIQVSKLALEIADNLAISKDELEAIKYAAILHDLGMMAMPEDIHYKSDPLSTKERLFIESHPEMGTEIIKSATFLKMTIPIIRHHHERFDGKGYPDGLAGDEIPLGSQILAVADSFVAMLTNRPYKKPIKIEKVVAEIKKQSGSQFNPQVVKAFLQTFNKESSNGEKNNT